MAVDPVDVVPIRFAEAGDLPRVLALLRLLHAETPHARLSEARLRETAASVLGTGAVVFSLAPGGEPVGTCGLAIEQPWFSDDFWLRDVWLFVHPMHRRTPHARALLRTARRYAERLNLPLVMEVAGGPAAGGPRRVVAKMRLYRRELGEPSGATWVIGGA
jgi:GNAT superfamily N-acetyltransferase